MSLKWPEPMPENGRLSARIRRNRRWSAAMRLLPVLALSLAACSAVPPSPSVQVTVPRLVKLQGGDIDAMNYSQQYIHTFAIEGPPGTGIGGGGANVYEIKPDGTPSTSGGSCCTSLPVEWQPDLNLTVRWLEYRLESKKVVITWYKAANVRIPQYDGQQAGTTWVIFLPDDRVKVMVADGNANGHNSVAVRPLDNDPDIAQGVPDSEWNEWYPNGIAKGLKQ